MAYCTYTDIIKATPDVKWHVDNYQQLKDDIAKASQLIDILTRRYTAEDPDGTTHTAYEADGTATARYFSACGGWHLAIDECVSISEVAVRFGSETSWTALASTDWTAWPYNRLPYFRIDIDKRQGSYSAFPSAYPQNVKVTAKWGYSIVVPDIVKKATIMQVVRWWKRGAQMFADVSPVGELGAPAFTRNLDPEIRTMILDSGLMKKQDLF